MADAARWTIGLLWAIAAVLGYGAARRSNGLAAWMLLVLGLLAAAAAALRWHVAVHRLARSALNAVGAYQQRVVFKVGVAVVLVGVIAVAGCLLASALRDLPRGLRFALVALVLWVIYLGAYTSFLDDLLPAGFAHWPLRQLLEGTFALTTLLGVLASRRIHAGTR